MLGSTGTFFGLFRASSLSMIKSLDLQSPKTTRTLPDLAHINPETVNALVDFHEGVYAIPDKFGTLAHQVMAADILGDDVFLQFIGSHFRVPVTRIDMSHTSHEIRNTVRDRMKLEVVVPSLQDSSLLECYVCKEGFLEEDAVVTVTCCRHTFHRTCILDVESCPFCTVAWGGVKVCCLWRAYCATR